MILPKKDYGAADVLAKELNNIIPKCLTKDIAVTVDLTKVSTEPVEIANDPVTQAEGQALATRQVEIGTLLNRVVDTINAMNNKIKGQ